MRGEKEKSPAKKRGSANMLAGGKKTLRERVPFCQADPIAPV